MWSCSTSGSHSLVIDHLNASGDGIARRQRQVIALPFTIPGEQVRARVRRLRDGSYVGVVEEILRPSPHRVAPHCPHFGLHPLGGALDREANPVGFAGGCGGCTWQHIAYPEQLRLKSELVTRLLREAVPRAPGALTTLTAVPTGSPWGYRQKVHFVFGAEPRERSCDSVMRSHPYSLWTCFRIRRMSKRSPSCDE